MILKLVLLSFAALIFFLSTSENVMSGERVDKEYHWNKYREEYLETDADGNPLIGTDGQQKVCYKCHCDYYEHKSIYTYKDETCELEGTRYESVSDINIVSRAAYYACPDGNYNMSDPEPACCGESDYDGDGYNGNRTNICNTSGNDCNDNDPEINPGMPEIIGDGKDNDCCGGDNAADT